LEKGANQNRQPHDRWCQVRQSGGEQEDPTPQPAQEDSGSKQ
jgi:hypothetical protein